MCTLSFDKIHANSNIDELKAEAKNLFGKKLITPQTGPQGKKVKSCLLYTSDAADE